MAKAAKPDKVGQVDRGERVEGDFGPGELLDVEPEKPEAKARPPLAASGRATARPCSAETAGTPTRNLLPC